MYVLNKEEGGRHTPFFKKYKPQFFFRTADVTGTVILPADIEMVMPGDNVSVSVELFAPVAIEKVWRAPPRRAARPAGVRRRPT